MKKIDRKSFEEIYKKEVSEDEIELAYEKAEYANWTAELEITANQFKELSARSYKKLIDKINDHGRAYNQVWSIYKNRMPFESGL